MFLGEYAHTLDTKGRLTIPVKFREALAGGGVVTRGYDKNLYLYTRAAFEQLTERLRVLSTTDPNHRALLRLQFSGASEADVDAQGRILVPSFLREYAALNGECLVVGVGDYVEIWSRAGWDEQLAIINNAGLNAERFADIKLVE
ncbi:MAG TPA: division/cell wall cluster transcriptional repressor MraZ [Anaerolineales bacterium]|nr:division/cell wall cluster transcriptional repressor MraZ [Anaerolineales bacterium]HRF49815.1 division/cell wall cluster transcriptional repressor MraZ [Anaerolineales bacterium]